MMRAMLTILMISLSAPLAIAEMPKASSPVSPITRVAPDPKYLEEHAFTLGVQAYEFAFPWQYNSLLRWRWSRPATNDRTPGGLAANELWHNRGLTNAKYRDGGTPNNDTLYSFAFLDVAAEPVILTAPSIKDRYFSVQFAGYDADNFDYIGTRATRGEGGHFAVVGPAWKGKLPKGVKPLKASHTTMALMSIRIAAREAEVVGAKDLSEVHRMQDQFKLTPLSRWKKPDAPLVAAAPAAPPVDPSNDPLADWKTINRALTEIPPPARHAALMRQFAQIGIGPGLDVEKVDDATRRGLIRASEAGRRIVTGAAAGFGRATSHNGWRYHPRNLARFGETDDFLARAGVVSLAGIIAHDNAEAIYIATMTDAEGAPITGARKYKLRFEPGQLPPADAFWSLTAYGADLNLIDNPLNRYSLGDRNVLTKDADGGVTLYVQKDNPGPDRESNWLPISEGPIKLTMRLYLPRAEALDGTWRAPPIKATG